MLIIIALQVTNGTSMEFVSYVYQNDEEDDIYGYMEKYFPNAKLEYFTRVIKNRVRIQWKLGLYSFCFLSIIFFKL